MSAYDSRGLMAQNGEEVTPSDSGVLNYDGLFLESDSTVVFTFRKRDNTLGNKLTLNLSAGYHPLRVGIVWATGSTINGKLIGLKG